MSLAYIPLSAQSDTTDEADPHEWYDLEEEPEDLPLNCRSNDIIEDNSLPPERQKIPLPSLFGKEACRGSLKHLAAVELDLRIGQANDTLRFLRIAIGQKSFLYRSKIRPSSTAAGYSKRLRNFAEVRTLQMSIDQAAKVYMSIRRAMENLGAGDSILSQYAVLTKNDIVASTAVADPNAPGQRNETLSWIWRMKHNGSDPQWIDERKLSILY